MGFFHWVFGKHPVKPAMPPDPNKVAVAGRVAMWQGPMLVSLLAERGIRATYAEMSLPDHGSMRSLTVWPQAIIYVMEPSRAEASRFIDEFLAGSTNDGPDTDPDSPDFEEFERQFDDKDR